MKPGLQVGQKGLMMGDRPQAQAEGTGEGMGLTLKKRGDVQSV